VIALERLAANTSENFWLSAEQLRDLGLDPQSFLVVQKPYSERRTLATARRILSMLVGEALRLEAYAASGPIALDEPVPAALLKAARALEAAGFSSRAVQPS
jgi:hypothetical protein